MNYFIGVFGYFIENLNGKVDVRKGKLLTMSIIGVSFTLSMSDIKITNNEKLFTHSFFVAGLCHF